MMRHEAMLRRTAAQGKVRTYYHGTANEPPEDEVEGGHVLPAGAHLHPDAATAWKHAIRHWNDDESTSFPRVYRAVRFENEPGHEHTAGGGIKLTEPTGATYAEHEHDEHPPIKLHDEEGPILFHGTTHYHDADDEDLNGHTPPHEITASGGTPTFGGAQHDPGYAYATKSLHSAWAYAEDRQRNHGSGTPHVYRVTPKRPEDLEEDPYYMADGQQSRGVKPGDMRAKSGFHVLDEVPPSRALHRENVENHQDEHGMIDWDDEDENDEGEHHEGARTIRRSQAQCANDDVGLRQGQDNGNVRTAAMSEERKAEIQRIREERKNRRRPTAEEARQQRERRDNAVSQLFTPIPEAELEEQRRQREPKSEPLDDHTYSLNDVSKHYGWEGFDSHEIAHLVHNPEHATFTHEDVPVHSLRLMNDHGGLTKPHSYSDIAGQDEDDEKWEHERLRSLERGHDEGADIPPIVVVRHGEHHIIADGSHRAAIAVERGHTHIPAFVTERTIMPKEASRKTAKWGDDGPLVWDAIGERHPSLYGDPEVHGEDADGADGEGIGWAANQLAHSRPDDPDAGNHGSYDLLFHEEHVDPKHIDYFRNGSGDHRVRHAREGYEERPSKVPPLVLVHRHGVYQVADGHHRAEGAALAGKKVRAYVAYSPYPNEPDGEGETGPYNDAEPHPGHHTASRRTAALHNPVDDKHPDEWFHGSPHEYDTFFDPGEHSPSAYEEGADRNHWNTLLGNHFTSDHDVAHEFSLGDHHLDTGQWEGDPNDQPLAHVIHAKLHLKNPKHYASEHDMDQEVHEHEYRMGNRISDHFDPEDREVMRDELGSQDSTPEAEHFDKEEFEPDEPYERHDYSVDKHPMATHWLSAHPDKHGIAMRYKKRLMDQGYDGIVYGNEYEKSKRGMSAPSVIAFHPHQVEITQHHYGKANRCLTPEEAKRQPGEGQQMIPGTEHYQRRMSSLSLIAVDLGQATGRLTAPLPQECWDRYHGLPKDWTTQPNEAAYQWLEEYFRQHRTAEYRPNYGSPFPVVKGPNGEPDEYPGNGIKQVRHSADMPVPLYHGTSAKFEPGDLIKSGHPGNFVRRMKHVYAIEDPEAAQNYGWHGLGSGWDRTKGNEQERHPRVYEVRPTGPYGHRSDAKGQNWASEDPWEVVREVWHHEPKESGPKQALLKGSMLDVFLAAWDDDDDEKPKWCEDCNEEHTEDEGHRPCAACGERHADIEEKNNHESTMTDWDHEYPRLPDEIHRGMTVELPRDVHRIVHNEGRHPQIRARELAFHLGGAGVGMHWTDDHDQAHHYADVNHFENATPIVLHAHKPAREQIETDPDTLSDMGVYGRDFHDDAEIPVSFGEHMKIKGISWKSVGENGHPHGDWHRHDFKEPMHMTAMRKHAHDSGDSQRIFHCPFCGAGQVIGRSDGTTECEFCQVHFTVQVQPQFNSFPQTINGQPVQIPGMPGQIGNPGMAPGMPPGAPGAPPGAEGDEGSGFPPGDDPDADGDAQGDSDGDGDGGDDKKPDFLKGKASKQFKTAAGDWLNEDQYTRHLAWMHAANKDLMARVMRPSRDGAAR
jgi:hypothetical protein